MLELLVARILHTMYYIMFTPLTWLTGLIIPTVHSQSEIDQLRDALDNAEDYEQWQSIAMKLDSLLGNDQWKERQISKDYDHKLIYYRLDKLRNDRMKGDIINIIYSLRSGLLRNLGGITDPRLYSRCYIGTKRLIQEYTREIVAALDVVAYAAHPDLPQQMKFDFFHETKQSFGCSALVLEGGATFGLFHMGVVKALHEQRLLPKILSGSAVGALIAALVCIHNDDELEALFHKDGINLSAFESVGKKGAMRRKIVRLLKYGHVLDVKVLEDCVRSNVGDLTFEEAYLRTRRILNITVASERPHEVPKVLNYLTAPNVLIWSAACASTAATYPLYAQVHLLAKDPKGGISKWSPTGRDITWVAAAQSGAARRGPSRFLSFIPVGTAASRVSAERESAPHHRLAEMFNVNHIIVSQAGALAAPMVLRGWRERHSFLARIASSILLEVRHRTAQAAYLGIFPGFIARWIAPATVTGDITVTPDLTLSDYKSLFANPNADNLHYWIRKGEASTWPLMSLLFHRCAIEFALDLNFARLRANAHLERQMITADNTKQQEQQQHRTRSVF